MIFPHFIQCPAFDLDQYSPRKNAPQYGQRFVENMSITLAINKGTEMSIITGFDKT